MAQSPKAHADKVAKVIAKAWADPKFKAKLKRNPAATLRAAGIRMEKGAKVTVHEERGARHHIVIPKKPNWSAAETKKRIKQRISPMLCVICSL